MLTHVSVPYRGATFLNIIMTTRKRKLKLVSVPYRGATFLNLLQAFLDRIYEAGVSVPYRGATFLNFCISTNYRSYPGFRPLSGSYISQFLYQYELPQLSGFPSPIGELHFSIRLCERRNEREKIIVSVPYRGATFLNSGTENVICSFTSFPSPIGELHFSIF